MCMCVLVCVCVVVFVCGGVCGGMNDGVFVYGGLCVWWWLWWCE